MQEKFSRILIGNVLKSIRTEQKIPIKKVAQNMDVSEATISQFETGKNKPTNEKITLFSEICGQTFNFDLDRDDNVKIKFTKMDRLFFTNLDRII